ncbi:magnesium transporter CorA family protein [Lacticaseibacillus jixiensis]|uniref:magnesium transporter CorA family protein n=1 Tax=Lacticaseibacillus jixiensis TaxID=3231926 RepID=UPI0036F39F9A
MEQTQALAGFVWHDLTQPTTSELDALTQRLALPEHFVAAIKDEYEQPRLDTSDPRMTLLVLRIPQAFESVTDVSTYRTVPITLVVGSGWLASVSLHDALAPALQTTLAASDDPLSAALAALQWTIAEYDHVLDDLSPRVQQMEGRVAEASHNRLLYEVMALEKALVHLTGALVAYQRLSQALTDSRWQAKQPVAIAELTVATNQVLSIAEATEEILDQYNTAISSVIGNNLNLIMKVLTSVSIILAIPPIISGIWGQNTWLPWEKPMYGFWVVLALSVTLSVAVAWWLRKKRYL